MDGYEPIPTHANFVLVRGPYPPQQMFEGLLEHDILARDVSHYPMLGGHFRVGVGTEDENAAVLAALQTIGEAAGAET